ncbi:MAG TPA: Hsp70 family protein, partial [Chthoniobacteraceae bacterium]|nr:Hsp70 family protein [Chthoniobacteraceae bacterium]
MSNTRTIGIDFGTHKTLVARWDEENRRPALIRLRPASGDDMPSVVHVDTGGTLTFGEEAEQLGAHDAEGCQRAFKRDLGINAAPYLLHAHEYSARDLAREYLRWIKALVEEESLHGPVDYAVITVPASWLPAARAELRQAAADAGFTSIELLDEPVAAGLAFLQSRRDLWAEGALLIFDWGAGTLDLAVLTLADGRPQSMPDLVGGKPGLGG